MTSSSSCKTVSKLVWGRMMNSKINNANQRLLLASTSSRFNGLSSINNSNNACAVVPFMNTVVPTAASSSNISVRTLSTTTTTPGAATDTLVDLLTREYDEEIENGNDQPPEEIDTLFKKLSSELGWKIIDNGKEDCLTKLYKTLGNGAKVQLVFHCQDIIDTTSEYHDEENLPEDEDDIPIQPSTSIKFSVCIAKGGKTIIYTCVTEEPTTLKIQSCMINNGEDIDTIIKEGCTVSVDQYQGPDFTTLADDIQDAMYSYLNDDIGVTNDVIDFIQIYTEFKESNQYINFLNQVRTIIK